MTVFNCWKPWTLSAVGNDNRMLRNKFVVVCKCPGGRDTINCQMPGLRGLIVKQMPGVCPGGMLAIGIDSHINENTIIVNGPCTVRPSVIFIFVNFGK